MYISVTGLSQKSYTEQMKKTMKKVLSQHFDWKEFNGGTLTVEDSSNHMLAWGILKNTIDTEA